jgi:hypothetical protein
MSRVDLLLGGASALFIVSIIGVVASTAAALKEDHAGPAPRHDQCIEWVCRPTWASDCACGDRHRLEALANGDVLCRCTTTAPDGGTP